MTLTQSIDGYVLRTTGGKYIGLDSSSGGYPYLPATIVNIHVWPTAEKAEEYKRILSGSSAFGSDLGPSSSWRVKHIVLMEIDDG